MDLTIEALAHFASPPGELRDLFQFPIRITPGPFELTPRVMQATQWALVGHRESEFIRILRENQRLLCDAMEVSPDVYFPVVFDSSGSGAMEAMAAAIVPRYKPLILVNGRFGLRLANIARLYRSDANVISFSAGKPIDLKIVERELDSNSDIRLLLFCRQDTREGILNPLKDLCNIAYERGLMVAIDSISSEVCEELEAEKNHISFFTASSGKAFRALPGLGIVFGEIKLLEEIPQNTIRSYYFNLVDHYRIQHDRGEPRFAPATALHICLNEALHELLEEGILNRRHTIQRRTLAVREAMERFGLVLSISSGHRCNSVTSILLPQHVEYNIFYERLRREGFLVYRGSSLIDNCFQIGTGGHLTDEILHAAFDAIEQCLRQLTPTAPKEGGFGQS